jgi:hypothetical protein
MTTTWNDSPKNRSYDVRRKIAAELGKPDHNDFTVPSASEVWVELYDGRCGDLTSTSNAGFRGIEGTFEDHENGARSTINLGDIISFEVIR